MRGGRACSSSQSPCVAAPQTKTHPPQQRPPNNAPPTTNAATAANSFAFWAPAIIYSLLASGVVSYSKNILYLIPLSIGAFLGTYLTVKFKQ